MAAYHGFNVEKPPFNDPLVRQPFAAAIDGEEVPEEAVRLSFRNVIPATALIPSETLRRNLYGDAGIPSDRTRARALLGPAGRRLGDGQPKVTTKL